MKGASLLLRMVDFNSRAVSTAITKPSTYKPSIASARVPRKTPSSGRFGRKAAITMVYTGRRAEQVMKGAMRMVGLYVLGFVMAVMTARLLKSTILRSKDAPFILEMPPYRWPTLASLGLRLVDRGKAFLYRAGTVIMLVTLLLWAATNFPMHHGQPPAVQDSIVAKLGHAIEPVIRPLGFDWQIGVGLVTSMAAREVIIATLGTLNGIDPQSHSMDLQAALRHELTPAAAVALLVFFALAMQCMSTIAVVRRETNGWKWPALQFGYMTVVAYVAAFAAYNIVGHFVR